MSRLSDTFDSLRTRGRKALVGVEREIAQRLKKRRLRRKHRRGEQQEYRDQEPVEALLSRALTSPLDFGGQSIGPACQQIADTLSHRDPRESWDWVRVWSTKA